MKRVQDFSGPKSLCRWAKKEIEEFDRSEKAFFDENPCANFQELDPTGKIIIHGKIVPAEIPDDIARSTYRIVSDLRNVLDQAVFAASCILQPDRDVKLCSFPIGQSKKELRGALRTAHKGRRFPDLAPSLHNKIMSFKPWPSTEGKSDGNDMLHALCRIANPNKHFLPIEIVLNPSVRVYGAAGALVSFGCVHRGNGKVETHRTFFGLPAYVDIEVHPQISFSDALLLTGKPVLPALNELHTMVEGIALSIEAETTRLLVEINH